MLVKILVCVPCHNRKQITELCVPTIAEGMERAPGRDILNLYNDGSDEYGQSFLYGLGADNVAEMSPAIGIERQRKIHFGDFNPDRFTHLYLTDADALHDPNWRYKALELQNRYHGLPVCLYDTLAHSSLKGNTIADDPNHPVIVRRVAPGISYLLTAEHVARVMKAMPELPAHWHWDWTTPAILGHQMIISRESHVDHIGLGGMHHPKDAGLDEGDRALNPTPFLVQLRAQVVGKLKRFDCGN